MSRFIPHPPNFTSMLALSFYVPALLGLRYLPALLISFVITDLFIGYHFGTHWTWGSVLIIGLMSKYFVKSCDAFLTLSRSVLDDLTYFTNSIFKKFILHPIYDVFGKKISKEVAIRNLNLSFDDRYLLFFGFIRKYKGLDLLLKAMADKRIKELGVKLIVAGEFYDNKNEYIALIKDLGIEKQIILHSDFIPADKVKNYFCASDIITQTYKTATQSGVTQIAYHFERPMLVTDVGGLAEIVPNNKVGYVTSQCPNDIASAIVDFYQNNREQYFSLNAKQEKQRFSWESFVNGIDQLMLSVKK